MNILVINGSPKGERSNSLRLTKAFLKGLGSALPEGESCVEQLNICDMNINACRGCFACWKATPGSCVIKDDMAAVIEKLLWAELIVYSFPLYHYGVPGALKNLIDRQLPMVLPFMEERTDGVGSGSHPTRYDMSGKRWVLISTCGFYSAKGNYDSVCAMFDYLFGKNEYEAIFCGQGELLSVKELSNRTDEYLRVVEKAGAEYASGGIGEQTRTALSQLLLTKQTYEALADASWGVSKETGEKVDDSLIFTRQMAALYNKASYDGTDRVLEICYNDLGKTYQLLMGKDGCTVYDDCSLTATTRIDTPWDVWVDIAEGKLRGDEALAKHLYTVNGDFSVMINWDKYFGEPTAGETENVPGETEEKKPQMATMLIAWIVSWVAMSIDIKLGAVIALAVCAILPLLMSKFALCIYDKLSFAAVGVTAVLALCTGIGGKAVLLGYLLFGLMWLVSCFTKEPLCAAYMKYGYGGNDALSNPIFMKTNYIIAAGWGVLYVLTAVWSFVIGDRLSGTLIFALNQLPPILMGIFTAWFQKWYPARVARGK